MGDIPPTLAPSLERGCSSSKVSPEIQWLKPPTSTAPRDRSLGRERSDELNITVERLGMENICTTDLFQGSVGLTREGIIVWARRHFLSLTTLDLYVEEYLLCSSNGFYIGVVLK